MRFRQLNLTRFGLFTDHEINFGELEEGRPDFHIIYGPNETGKSTLLAAILDLFFGIEMRSPYSFLHAYNTMQIGAAIEANGSIAQFARVKARSNSLQWPVGSPVPESLVKDHLGQLDRDSYANMFSLNEVTLEKGGESILASEGELGALLFSASAGLSGLSRNLTELRAGADAFHKPRARNTGLGELKARLSDLKDQLKEVDTKASEYSMLVATRNRMLAQYEEATAEKGSLQSKLKSLQGQSAAYPKLASYQRLREELKTLEALPEALKAWFEEVPELRNREIELSTGAKALDAEISRIRDELGKIAIDKQAINLVGRNNRLSIFRSRHETAEKDLPERRRMLKEVRLSIDLILARIERQGESNPADLLLGVATSSAVRELIELKAVIDAKLEQTRLEIQNAREQLEKARRAAEAAGFSNESTIEEFAVEQLSATISEFQASSLDAHLSSLRKRCEELAEQLANRLSKLRPWTGNADELFSMQVPETAEIERRKQVLAAALEAIVRHKEEIGRLEGERIRLREKLHTAGGGQGTEDDHAVAAIRADREQKWARHKEVLDIRSAEIFEVALRRDDLAMTERLRSSVDAAEARRLRQELDLKDEAIRRAREALERAQSSLREQEDQAKEAIRGVSHLLSGLPFARLESWILSREHALEARGELIDTRKDLLQAEVEGRSADIRLAETLKFAGISFPDDASRQTLLLVAQSAVKKAAKSRDLSSTIVDRKQDLSVRERALEGAQLQMQDWKNNWAATCSECWLGDGGSVPQVAEVKEKLEASESLGPKVERSAGLADRIIKMENDQRQFRQEIAEMAGELGIDHSGLPPIEAADIIASKINSALAERKKAEETTTRLEDAIARKEKLAKQQDTLASQKGEFLSLFKVDSLAEVERGLGRIERRDLLRTQATELEDEIRELLKVSSIEAAEGLLKDFDASVVETRISELEARLSDKEHHVRGLFANHVKAKEEVDAVGGDDAAAKVEEERQTVQIEIEDGVERYLRRVLGIAAAEHALQIYRDRHRSSMMKRASDSFSLISRGAYTELSTQPDKGKEILIAIPEGGGSKTVTTLSRGTRCQLYLTLRVAGYHELLGTGKMVVPFVADDIMETFDDYRAEAALGLFAEMARTGQVIYLTHHLHLREIARKVCPDVRIHVLEEDR